MDKLHASVTKPRAPKPPTLTEIAERIHLHLQRFEADKAEGGVNWWDDGKVNGTRPYFHAHAYQGGGRVCIRYISYQGTSCLKRAEAMKYLQWLDAGNVGRHVKALR